MSRAGSSVRSPEGTHPGELGPWVAGRGRDRWADLRAWKGFSAFDFFSCVYVCV